ncbi:hypothetical protein [Clostridium sp. JN-1]|uniref:hypothetical protein n=1 Tax=Clostridium sp. JN-1 TaxID=2483110 RepID=UPI000F0B6FE3|nr:hypothetical protein [Clostridium sp. JN-1]
MEDNEIEQYFNILLENYRSGKFKISWRPKSVFIADDINFNDAHEEKGFREFVSKFVDALRDRVFENKNDEKYSKYVNTFLEEDKYLKDDMQTRCTSISNLCNFFNIEILTKRDRNQNTKCYSALVNMNLQKPCLEGKPIIEPITFELSIRDLKTFSDSLEDTIRNIEKLKDNL